MSIQCEATMVTSLHRPHLEDQGAETPQASHLHHHPSHRQRNHYPHLLPHP